MKSTGETYGGNSQDYTCIQYGWGYAERLRDNINQIININYILRPMKTANIPEQSRALYTSTIELYNDKITAEQEALRKIEVDCQTNALLVSLSDKFIAAGEAALALTPELEAKYGVAPGSKR